MARKPTKHGTPWSAADKAELRAVARRDDPTTTIAVNLKRTVRAVESKADELGISLGRKN